MRNCRTKTNAYYSLRLPLNTLWAFVFGYIWCYVLSQPETSVVGQYQQSVWLISAATVLDSVSETPYIIGQYFQYSKLRVRTELFDR